MTTTNIYDVLHTVVSENLHFFRITQATYMRVLTVNDVGEALMKSFKYDKV